MSDNLFLYNKVRTVPEGAQKEIKGGRLSGKTDINPMWRIKALTEQFGPCGIGWRPVIKKSWLETGANGEISAFVEIDLYVKIDGQWSEPIPGTGGSAFVANESKGLYTSDECFKMAFTDAISVACKLLGFGADVYWEKDSSKYDSHPDQDGDPGKPLANPPKSDSSKFVTMAQIKELEKMAMELKGLEKTTYWDFLKRLEREKKISSQYPMNKDKKIQWTGKDYEAIKYDLELPF
jgi:hypothetical protein